jgi:hypothetical protein
MKKIIILLFSTYFLIGAILLPQSNFALLFNLPTMYTEFVSINGDASYLDFLDEQFVESYELFDMEKGSDSKPEKEKIPVAMDCSATQFSSVFKMQVLELEFNKPSISIEHTAYYPPFNLSEKPAFIFHPPKLAA